MSRPLGDMGEADTDTAASSVSVSVSVIVHDYTTNLYTLCPQIARMGNTHSEVDERARTLQGVESRCTAEGCRSRLYQDNECHLIVYGNDRQVELQTWGEWGYKINLWRLNEHSQVWTDDVFVL